MAILFDDVLATGRDVRQAHKLESQVPDWETFSDDEIAYRDSDLTVLNKSKTSCTRTSLSADTPHTQTFPSAPDTMSNKVDTISDKSDITPSDEEILVHDVSKRRLARTDKELEVSVQSKSSSSSSALQSKPSSLDSFLCKRRAAGQLSKMPKKKKKTGIDKLADTMTALNEEMEATHKFMRQEATKTEQAMSIFMKDFKDMLIKDLVRLVKILKEPSEATVFLSLESEIRTAWVESFLNAEINWVPIVGSSKA